MIKTVKKIIKKDRYIDFTNFFKNKGGIEEYCKKKYNSRTYLRAKLSYSRDCTQILNDIKNDFNVEYKFVKEKLFYILEKNDYFKLKKANMTEIETELGFPKYHFLQQYKEKRQIPEKIMLYLVEKGVFSMDDLKSAASLPFRWERV